MPVAPRGCAAARGAGGALTPPQSAGGLIFATRPRKGAMLDGMEAIELEVDIREDGIARLPGVPAGRAMHPRLQAGHAHFAARGFLAHVDQPGCGPLILEGAAWSGTRMGSPRCTPAPMIGEHTAEVLDELLDVDAAALDALVASGAVEAQP